MTQSNLYNRYADPAVLKLLDSSRMGLPEHQEYPKALRPPNYSKDRVFKPQLVSNGLQSWTINIEDQEAGPYAQVIVNNRVEEEAVLAAWKDQFGYEPPMPASPQRTIDDLQEENKKLRIMLEENEKEQKAAMAKARAITDDLKSKVVNMAPKAEPKPKA